MTQVGLKQKAKKSLLFIVAVGIMMPIIGSYRAEDSFLTPVRHTFETWSFERTQRQAEQGLMDAQFKLAYLYATGKGVPQDDAEAFKWMLKAAGQGKPAAQYYLGLMYEGGHGIEQNQVEAERWIELAIKNGYKK
ncbi:MAG: sel1 repeat family protein [Alphaproteobacteria bacterium]|nr:sel1 repeat family protein [Alphaproteobacteria bacterium]